MNPSNNPSSSSSEDSVTGAHQPINYRNFWRRWGWVRTLLTQWRNEEGSPYHEPNLPPNIGVLDPLTGEPVRNTVFTLIARIFRLEGRLAVVKESVQPLLPSANQVGLLEEVRRLQADNQVLLSRVETLEELVQNLHAPPAPTIPPTLAALPTSATPATPQSPQAP